MTSTAPQKPRVNLQDKNHKNMTAVQPKSKGVEYIASCFETGMYYSPLLDKLQNIPRASKNIPSTRGKFSVGPTASALLFLKMVLMTPPSPVKSIASPIVSLC
ncbi:hypothetical protein V8G54_019815 [Vigna mungo]|uniref:Uncharacterized protein n=1 Tax=Vigna mungo TaxID=3915 RepID=A0AAQ3RVV4_VIGMU